MPVRATLSLKGAEEYLRKLANAEKILDFAALEGLENAGHILLEEMQDRVPIGETKKLYEHLIFNGPFSIADDYFIYVELDMRNREEMLYGVFVEYGTPFMPPRSYIRAGFDAGRSRAKKAILDALRKVADFE